MNWRTVRAIRRGRRRGESGQAFSELAVSLVMIILPAFVGFLIVAVLCTNGVSNTILARESADRYCAAGAPRRDSVEPRPRGCSGLGESFLPKNTQD